MGNLVDDAGRDASAYYEVREDGLFLRLRSKKRLLPYASLVEVSDQPNRTVRGGAANLVRVTTNSAESIQFGSRKRIVPERAVEALPAGFTSQPVFLKKMGRVLTPINTDY